MTFGIADGHIIIQSHCAAVFADHRGGRQGNHRGVVGSAVKLRDAWLALSPARLATLAVTATVPLKGCRALPGTLTDQLPALTVPVTRAIEAGVTVWPLSTLLAVPVKLTAESSSLVLTASSPVTAAMVITGAATVWLILRRAWGPGPRRCYSHPP